MNANPKLTIAKLTLGMFLLAGPLAIAGQGKDQPAADPSAVAGGPDAEDSQGKIKKC